MQTNFVTTPNHERSKTCKRLGAKFQQHANAEVAARALEETFTVYGVELEGFEVFKYLDCNITYGDSAAQAIHKNLGKVRAM